MFGKAKCKLCGEDVHLALRHLKNKHGIFEEIKHMSMEQIMKKYFKEE